MKSLATLTMKSKQVWMKSKPCGFDEIKSVYLSAAGDFIHDSGFIPSKTDLDKKTPIFYQDWCFFLELLSRLELPTSSLPRKCSTC